MCPCLRVCVGVLECVPVCVHMCVIAGMWCVCMDVCVCVCEAGLARVCCVIYICVLYLNTMSPQPPIYIEVGNQIRITGNAENGFRINFFKESPIKAFTN